MRAMCFGHCRPADGFAARFTRRARLPVPAADLCEALLIALLAAGCAVSLRAQIQQSSPPQTAKPAASAQPASARQSPSPPGRSSAAAQSQPAAAPAASQAVAPALAPDSYVDDQPSLGDQRGQMVEASAPQPDAAQPTQSQANGVLPPAPAIESATPAPAVAAAAAPPPVPVPAKSSDPSRQQINDECASLLAMADSLKMEVDKTTKDELSVAVVRKAGEIEQLARKVRDDMRPTMGKN